MAGIYIHIPFCKTHCSYCDFYSVTNTRNIADVIEAICTEAELRSDYLDKEAIETIYFGGGTPSFIPVESLANILDKIRNNFQIIQNPEITIEVNPDDISGEKAKQLLYLGFNRVSVGIQSFDDTYLTMLKRRHNSGQAAKSVEILKSSGFSNISIDLIYGIPGMKLNEWKDALKKALSLNVKHVSAYHLTIEKGTELFSQYKKGKIFPVSETDSEQQYAALCKTMKLNGFDHYEISNFSLPGFASNHNNSYWTGKKYMGLGPAAHSFNGNTRQWNVSDAEKYCSEISASRDFFSFEKLSKKDKYNEYLLISLRTSNGISLTEVESRFGKTYLDYFQKQSTGHLNLKSLVVTKNNRIIIPENKWFVSDGIISDVCKV